jgi:hypothetical protein
MKARLTVELNPSVLGRLKSSALHRRMGAEELAAALVTGTITRGSVDAVLLKFHDWATDNRGNAIDDRAHKRKSNGRIGA